MVTSKKPYAFLRIKLKKGATPTKKLPKIVTGKEAIKRISKINIS
jgi:hypothetical protein